MITLNFLFLLLVLRSSAAQYLLAEYAPSHDNYTPANYHFSYGVSDPTTGDHKHHWEKRQGDHVVGEYGLLEPDGATRIVQYTADPHKGFQAVVTRIENPYHVTPDKYTQGHALYGGPQHSLYTPQNVMQFGNIHQQNLQNIEIQKAIELGAGILPDGHQEHIGESLAQNPIIVENQPHHENLDRYYLNQYAGHYQGPEQRGFEENLPLEQEHYGQQQIQQLPQHIQEVHAVQQEHVPQQRIHIQQQIPQHIQEVQQVHTVQQEHVPQQEIHVQQQIPQHIQAHQQVHSVQQEHVPQQEIHVQQQIPQHIQVHQQVHSVQQEHVPQQEIHVPQQEVHVPQQELQVPQQEVHLPQQEVHLAQQEVQVQQHVHIPQEVQQPVHLPQPESSYSTLQHQPNYQQVYQQELPQHVIENLQNQYGNEQGAVEARNFPQQGQIDNNALVQHIKQQITQQDGKFNYVISTTEGYPSAVSTEKAFVSTERPEYVSTTERSHHIQSVVQPSVQVIPNGENAYSTTAQPPIQVTTERNLALNPILMNLMAYIKDHMPEKFKQTFPDSLKQFLPTEATKIVSTTASPVEITPQNFAHNPYLNGEIQNVPNQQKENAQNEQNYQDNPYLNGEFKFAKPIETKKQAQEEYRDKQNEQKIYYELDPAAYQQQQGYQQDQNQGYQQIQGYQQQNQGYQQQNQVYQPQNYEQNVQGYQQEPNIQYQQNYNGQNNQGYQQGYLSQQDTSSIQQGKDGSVYAAVNENGPNLVTPNFYQPVNPNMYNNPNFHPNDNSPAGTNNDFIWQAGDYTAPREPEVLPRHLNATCVSIRFNQTNDYEQKDQDVHIWNSGDYTALRAEEELVRSINITCENFTNDYQNNFTSGFNLWQYCSQCLNPVDEEATITAKDVVIGPNGQPVEIYYNANPQINVYPQEPQNNQNQYDIYQDSRSNGEIAGIVKVINPNYKKPVNDNKNFDTLLNEFNAHLSQQGQDYLGNGYQESDGSPVVYYERVQRKAGN